MMFIYVYRRFQHERNTHSTTTTKNAGKYLDNRRHMFYRREAQQITIETVAECAAVCHRTRSFSGLDEFWCAQPCELGSLHAYAKTSLRNHNEQLDKTMHRRHEACTHIHTAISTRLLGGYIWRANQPKLASLPLPFSLSFSLVMCMVINTNFARSRNDYNNYFLCYRYRCHAAARLHRLSPRTITHALLTVINIRYAWSKCVGLHAIVSSKMYWWKCHVSHVSNVTA